MMIPRKTLPEELCVASQWQYSLTGPLVLSISSQWVVERLEAKSVIHMRSAADFLFFSWSRGRWKPGINYNSYEFSLTLRPL